MLSYDEYHKHLHLNVHNESQLNVSSLFKDIFSPHYSLFGNTSVTNNHNLERTAGELIMWT